MEKLQEIKWGSFTPIHFLTIILSVVMIVGIYFLLRRRQEKTQRIVLFILALTGPAAVIYNILVWGLQSTVLEYLPLHLCSVNALLLPVLVAKKSNFLGNLLPVYSVGAVAALLFNTFQADYSIFSFVFAMFYFPHTFEVAVPILMIALGLVKIRPKYIAPCLGFTFILYTAIHFCNLWINDYLAAKEIVDSAGNIITVNYMYSLGPMGNPALEFFRSLIPYDYFYMLAVIPVIALAYLGMNARNIVKWAKEKKS